MEVANQVNSFSQINQQIVFLEDCGYFGNDLGVTFQADKTTFKCWTPAADAVTLLIYHGGDATVDDCFMRFPMKQVNHCWTVTVTEKVKDMFYTFEIQRGSEKVETVDLYAKAVGINGNRGAIVDLSETNPEGWLETKRNQQTAITNAYIWEVHVEDFSSSDFSGISEENRGKYLAFTEKNTHLKGDENQPTGLAYLKQLGINYVHLLPIFDFDNDELSETYNWGYDPKNYNVPEGKYSSNPRDPKARIRECKQMIQALHEASIGVVMDVVFNHTAITEDSWFNLTVPNYYYRQDENGNFANGSACGNEVASERKMVRKFIIDSVLFWAEEYKIDGFRFDLMGLIDIETMNQLRNRLDNEGFTDVILYGEPWDAGTNQIKEPNIPANKRNVWALDERIAVFNDDLRDNIKGDVFEETDGAFVQGMNGKAQIKQTFHLENLATAIQGNIKITEQRADNRWAKSPQQIVSYVSVHDNLTLWDKLVATTQALTKRNYDFNQELLQLNKLAAVILFTSQGAILTQAGEEFGRTKFGDENSFRSPKAINQLDWVRVKKFKELQTFYRGMWKIRQFYPPLRNQTKDTAEATKFIDMANENFLAYIIPNTDHHNSWKSLAVLVNSSEEDQSIAVEKLGQGNWGVIADDSSVDIVAKEIVTGTIRVSSKGFLILAC
jgi:pullulanase